MLVLNSDEKTRVLKKYLPQIIVVSLSVIILYIALGDILFSLNQYMLHDEGDGLKNYFTPAYYLRYDEGTHFSGMNYPFGEHIVFTDNQPIFALFLNWIDNHIFEIWPYTIGIYNFLLLLSIPFCALLLYLIGKHYYLPTTYAIIIALIITFLSPQMIRLKVHYALAYACFVPLVWYLLIHLNQSTRKYIWWAIWIAVVFIFGLIHVYYILMGVIMTMAYQLLTHLIHSKEDKWKKLAISLALAVVPLILFKLFLAFTDPVTDRPESPYGFFHYKAYWESVWMPHQGPVRQLIEEFIEVRRVPGESVAYVGFVGFLVLLFSIVRLVQWGRKKRFRKWIKPAFPKRLGTATWAGMLVFFFSIGIPFTWGLDFLLDFMPPLKQFRSLGRFAWVPYYMFSMYTAVYVFMLYRLFRYKGMKAIGGWILGIILVFWAWEASIHTKVYIHSIGAEKRANFFKNSPIDYNEWLAAHNLSANDFQAVLSIPAFFIGSEKFIPRFPHPDAINHSFLASYQTGLPMACVMMSRTSLSESLEVIQIMSNEMLEKTVLSKYENDKPLLIIAIKDVVLTVNEQKFLPKAELIDTKGNIQLMQLDLSKLKSKKEEIWQKWEAEKDSLIEIGPHLYAHTDSIPVLHRTFDQGETRSSFGTETLKDDNGPVTVADEVIPYMVADEWIRWSLYIKADGRRDAFPVVIFRELDPNGKVVQQAELNAKFEMNIYQDWVLLEHEFKIQNPLHKINIYTEGIYPNIESLLIRPLDTEVFHYNPPDSTLMYNNYYYSP